MIIVRALIALLIFIIGFAFYPGMVDFVEQWYGIAQTIYTMPTLDHRLFQAAPLILLGLLAYACIMALTGGRKHG